MQIYGVSRTTVRLALKDLEEKGYIFTQHGKGSYVAKYHESLVNLSEQYSFTEHMKGIGKKPKTKLLAYSLIQKNKELTEFFPEKDEYIIELIRLRLADGKPMLYEKTYIPYSKFEDVLPEELNHRSLYTIFKEDYNEHIKLAHEEFSVGIASQEITKYLDINENSPFLKIYRRTINLNNEIIEYTKSYASPNQFSYQTIHYNPLNRY